MTPSLAIAILAAGSSSRFGGGKLDADLAGKRLGSYAVEAALPLGKPKLVTGPTAPEFANEAMACGDAQILKNRRTEEGLATSVTLAAMQAAAAGSEALLLLAADMPLVTSASLRKLVDAVIPGRPAAAAHPEDGAGIPACFPADWFPALAALAGDKGAGTLLREAPNVTLVKLPHDELADVDTAEELAALRARHKL